MTHTGMTWRFAVNVVGASSAEAESILEEHLDNLMDELLKLEKCNAEFHDPSVGATLSTGEVEIECMVDATADEAVALARPILRTAIHAAGGATPRWDDGKPLPSHVVEYEPETTQITFA